MIPGEPVSDYRKDYALSNLIPRLPQKMSTVLIYYAVFVITNWSQVSSFAQLSEIDEREGNQFETEMTFLLGLKP